MDFFNQTRFRLKCIIFLIVMSKTMLVWSADSKQKVATPSISKQPGLESEMNPKPIFDDPNYLGSHKLQNKVAVITGGDSGIGRATAVAFAKEGADIVIMYLNEDQDANDTKNIIQNKYGRKVLLISGDIGSEKFCKDAITQVINKMGKINILVNNAAENHPQPDLEKITEKHLIRTFETNVFGIFYLTKAALPHLHKDDTIINTVSVVAYKGGPTMIDYTTTKGAIVSFTRSLAMNLVRRGIRVNAVAPGPVWTPLVTASFPNININTFGQDAPLGRPAQPFEIAPSFVFLASSDSASMTGQVLHPNGGFIVAG